LWERALQIMAMGKVQLKPIITNRVRLEDWHAAFERLERKEEIKVMIYPNEKYFPK
jgi:threonine dehydrogenase-like Zn-dependent dehydrogenase